MPSTYLLRWRDQQRYGFVCLQEVAEGQDAGTESLSIWNFHSDSEIQNSCRPNQNPNLNVTAGGWHDLHWVIIVMFCCSFSIWTSTELSGLPACLAGRKQFFFAESFIQRLGAVIKRSGESWAQSRTGVPKKKQRSWRGVSRGPLFDSIWVFDSDCDCDLTL